jgi:FMN-dependent NADH-azoreductase
MFTPPILKELSMSRLLYIEASPRKARSYSIQIAKFFIDEYKKKHPEVHVETLDLWHQTLPRFDGDVIDAKYAIMHRQSHSEAQRKAWRAVEDLIDQFKAADKYVISIPMWNFSIPYILKQYIDNIVQPGYTFTFSPTEGYNGLVVGKPITLIYSRGGAYGSGTGAESLDLQKAYMETLLKFIGFTEIHSIFIEPTMGSEEQKKTALENARTEAVALAAKF